MASIYSGTVDSATNQVKDAELAYVEPGNVRTDKYQNALADLTRQQFEDYKNRFLPVQEELFGLATSDKLLNEQMQRNEKNIDNAFAQSQVAESQRLGRYGLSPEETAQGSANKGLLKGLTTASINNETRESVDDLQNKILTGQGGAPKSLADIGGK